jgi:hypothetical protein
MVFRCAYAHFKSQLCSELMEAEFASCYIEDKNKMKWIYRVPPFVEDYCLSLLAKKVSLPTNQEMALFK